MKRHVAEVAQLRARQSKLCLLHRLKKVAYDVIKSAYDFFQWFFFLFSLNWPIKGADVQQLHSDVCMYHGLLFSSLAVSAHQTYLKMSHKPQQIVVNNFHSSECKLLCIKVQQKKKKFAKICNALGAEKREKF